MESLSKVSLNNQVTLIKFVYFSFYCNYYLKLFIDYFNFK